jgi:hypothetical protein
MILLITQGFRRKGLITREKKVKILLLSRGFSVEIGLISM